MACPFNTQSVHHIMALNLGPNPTKQCRMLTISNGERRETRNFPAQKHEIAPSLAALIDLVLKLPKQENMLLATKQSYANVRKIPNGTSMSWQARMGRAGKVNLGILSTDVEAAEAADEGAFFVYGR